MSIHDISVRIVERIMANLEDRKGIGDEIMECDDDILREIENDLQNIVEEEIISYLEAEKW